MFVCACMFETEVCVFVCVFVCVCVCVCVFLRVCPRIRRRVNIREERPRLHPVSGGAVFCVRGCLIVSAGVWVCASVHRVTLWHPVLGRLFARRGVDGLTQAGKDSRAVVVVTNIGTTALYFNWTRVDRGGPSILDGVAPEQSTPRELSRFGCPTLSGSLLPSTTTEFVFTFTSPNPVRVICGGRRVASRACCVWRGRACVCTMGAHVGAHVAGAARCVRRSGHVSGVVATEHSARCERGHASAIGAAGCGYFCGRG